MVEVGCQNTRHGIMDVSPAAVRRRRRVAIVGRAACATYAGRNYVRLRRFLVRAQFRVLSRVQL